ncbi:hypothetical protein [Actinomadura logoneensis]|uniref:hypothetical protein n=1 Tax=Actinomadura logoneensis TaxID=2293572 RepID=UPI001314BBB1|nr:hypothetical protein [Actinomadura logoneensis]
MSRSGGGARRGALIGAGAAATAAVVATGVTLALTAGGGDSGKDQVKTMGEASRGTLAAGPGSGSARPSGKGKRSPGATPSASGSGSASPGGSPGASPSSPGAPTKGSGPGSGPAGGGGGGGNSPKATGWMCGPRQEADRRQHYLTACIRFDGQYVRLRATLDPVASRNDPKLIASNQMRIILVLKRAADQTNAGTWTSPPCTTLVCTWEYATIPARDTYRTLAKFSYQGIWQGDSRESPPLNF